MCNTTSGTLAASQVSSTSRTAGAAVAAAKNLKRWKYASIGNGYIFLPFATETLGSWGPDTRLLFKKSSKRLIDETNDQRAGTLGRKSVFSSNEETSPAFSLSGT